HFDALPDAWIPPRSASMGFLPDVGVHRYGNKLVQETSRAVRAQVVVLFGLAALALIPASAFGLAFPHYVQVVAALGLAWGAACGLVFVPWIERRYGHTVIVDLDEGNVTIDRYNQITDRDEQTVVPIARVVGLQLLRAPAGEGGFELNLVYCDA